MPWAHIDIAGTAQQPAGRRTWRTKGATGFGARLLIELATGFAGTGRGHAHERGRTAAPSDRAKPAARSGFLGWIERVGNKVPHPAMIFLGLIVGVIVLSAVMSWAGVSVTTDVAEPVPHLGRRRPTTTPARRTPRSPRTHRSRSRLRDPPGDHRGQEPAQRRRHPAHVHHGRPELQRLRRGRGDPRGDDRRRRGRGGRADRRADPQDGAGRRRQRDHVHHRAASAASRASPPTPATWS